MDVLWQDLRTTFRQFRHKPGFTVLVVLTISMGIGPNAALFSIVDGILLRSLHYESAGELSMIWNRLPGRAPLSASFSKPEWVDLRERSRSFQDLEAFGYGGSNVIGKEGLSILWTGWVSSGFLSLIGVEPILGRSFLPEEHMPGNHMVALVAYHFWQRQYNGDRGILGQTFNIDDEVYTIIGVMPPDFELPLDFQWAGKTTLVLPLAEPKETDRRTSRFIHVLGRLKEGVSLQEADSEIAAIAQRLRQEYPDSYPDDPTWSMEVERLHDVVVGDVRAPLLLLFAAVGFVLLIACANLANLLLARALARRQDSVIRLALGAGRRRIVRQLLTESTLLSLLGGVLGLLLAAWGLEVLISLVPGNFPRLEEVSIDLRVLGFTFILSVATGLVLGMLPVMRTWKLDLQSMIKQGGRGVYGGSHLFRRMLIVSEVALSLLLLICAGLVLRSFVNLQQVDLGFTPDKLSTLGVQLVSASFPENHQVRSTIQRIEERLASLPGVSDVGAVSSLPLFVPVRGEIFKPERPPGGVQDGSWTAGLQVVTPGYFRAMQIPLLAGRAFADEIHEGAPPGVMVNATLARRFGSPEQAIGQRLRIGEPPEDVEDPAESPWYSILGVVGDIHHNGLDAEPEPELYVSHLEKDFSKDLLGRFMYLVLRSTIPPEQLAEAVRREIRSIDRMIPLGVFRLMEDLLSQSVGKPRFATVLLSIFGVLALLLAALGIYGVMSYLTEQRRPEIGIRMALGAERNRVLKGVLREGALLSLAGVVLGLLGAYWLTRLLSSLLFGVEAADAATFVAGAMALVLVALLATLEPARRASRVEPIEVLRSE